MRYVILRDDDTNALTPVECLEHLYRPFLHRQLPVNLAVIPRVRTDVRRADGLPEGFLFARTPDTPPLVPLSHNASLVSYLHENSGFHIAQHGYHHSLYEFDSENAQDIEHRLELGTQVLGAAGFAKPTTFVAPYDKLSRVSLRAVAKRFRVLSTGWFELRRLPFLWWPMYAWKKLQNRPHWRVHRTMLLSHPGCLLSYMRPYGAMLDEIKRAVTSQEITVLVTHWWEYFRNGEPDEDYIRVLHNLAEWLASQHDVKVISFDDLATGNCIAN